MPSLLFALLTLTTAVPALAGDGRQEISQTCAVNTGCFPGDAPGFPITIATPGSYLLTSNLQLPNATDRGIEISTSNVTVDLRGFEIRGVTTCSGTPLVCAPLGSGDGVAVQNTFLNEDVRVMNGSVTGVGNHGVVVGVRGVVEKVNATQNGNVGIFGDRGSILRNNVAGANGIHGLNGALYSTITGNNAYQNGMHGIVAGPGSSATGNNASRNQSGIVVGTDSRATGNSTYQNRLHGIDGGDRSAILNNTASANGTFLPLGTAGDGIRCGVSCRVGGNAARDNIGYGLFLGLQSVFLENVLTGNLTGTVPVINPPTGFPNPVSLGDPINLGFNHCDGPADYQCPNVVPSF